MRSNIFNLKAAAQTTAYGSQAATTALLARLPALGNHSNVIRVDEDLQYDLCKVFSQRCINVHQLQSTRIGTKFRLALIIHYLDHPQKFTTHNHD